MSAIVEERIRKAAEGFASIPEHFAFLKIKESLPKLEDWQEFNHRLCHELALSGCTTMEDQLDDFWEYDDTFQAMIDYIDEDCGVSSSKTG